MPDLRRVPQALGFTFTTAAGKPFRALLRPPPPPGPGYEPVVAPRRALLVGPEVGLPATGWIRDPSGLRFLHALWSNEGVVGQVTAQMHVLFAVTGDETWSRPSFTLEPISGQRLASGSTVFGTTPTTREFFKRKNDALDVEEEVYRVVCLAALQVGDFLGDRRILKVESVLGLTTAEVF